MSDVPVSPDLRQYAPLAPYERSAVDIAVTALQDLADNKLPGVTLREHMTEVMLIETLAAMLGDFGVALDRIPAVVFEAALRLFDVQHDAGTQAVTTLEFTLSDAAGHTVPAGTEVAVDVADGVVVFSTDADLVIAAASTTGTVAATATSIGDDANGVTAGTAVRLRSAISFVQGVTIDVAVSGGTDPETDTAYFSKAAQRFQRLTEVLVLKDHFTAAALEVIGTTGRVLTIETYDGVGGPPYTDGGHVTVVARAAGGNLSGGDKTALEDTLEEATLVDVEVHVINATVTPIDVASQIVPVDGAVAATVQAAVEAALTSFLNTDTWPWWAKVRYTDVVALIETTAGVDHIVAGTLLVEGGTGDVTLTGDGPLTAVGTLDIDIV